MRADIGREDHLAEHRRVGQPVLHVVETDARSGKHQALQLAALRIAAGIAVRTSAGCHVSVSRTGDHVAGESLVADRASVGIDFRAGRVRGAHQRGDHGAALRNEIESAYCPVLIERIELDVQWDVGRYRAGCRASSSGDPGGAGAPLEPYRSRCKSWRSHYPHRGGNCGAGRQMALGGVKAVQSQTDLLQVVRHCAVRAASRAACTAGKSNAIRMPMIVITTKSSMSVKPRGNLGIWRFGDLEVSARRYTRRSPR